MTQGRVAALIVALLALAGLAVIVRDGTAGTATPTIAAPAPAPALPEPAPGPAPTTSTSPRAVAEATGATTVTTAQPAALAGATSPSTQPGLAPGPLVVPAPGTFRYRYGGSVPSIDGSLTIAAGPGPRRQTFRLGAGDASEQTLVEWSTGARTIVSAGVGSGCDWSPGLLSLRLPLVAGATWRADSTCTAAGSTVHRVEDAKVEGATRTSVAGRSVDVWVISRHTLTEVGAGSTGRAVVEAQSSELFAPSIGLVVYQVTRTAAPQADGTTATTTQTVELMDNRPV